MSDIQREVMRAWRPTTPVQRAAVICSSALPRHRPASERARAVLLAAIDDPNLAPRISEWRNWCEHSRVLNPREHRDGEPAEWEQACSPCVRDRLRAWLLDGAR